MKYTTYKSIAQDFHNDKLTKEQAIFEIEKLKEKKDLEKINRDINKLLNRLNNAADEAGFTKPK